METWAWLLAYVVGFGLLQLVLYHHFRRNDATPDSAPASSERAGAGSIEHAADTSADPGIYCPECGTRNEREPMVRYCRQCVSHLR